MWDSQLEKITVAGYRIASSSSHAPPIHSAHYRAGLRQWEFDRVNVPQMRKAGIAASVVAEWTVSIAFLLKWGRQPRFWFNSRLLIATTVRDRYSTLCMDDCIDCLGNVKLFLTLNDNSEDRQNKTDEKYVKKTAFVTHDGFVQQL